MWGPSYCLDHFPKAKKYYFIQDFEAFSREEDYVRQTYRLGLVNIVISNWLKKIVAEESGKVPILVQNGIDTDAFTELVPFNNREKLSVCFLYHSSPIKNVKMTLDVIERLKAEFPSMKVYSFGTVPVMGSLPNYIDYTYNASEQEVISIYNKSRYFISATTKEGWGLTCLEAMSCGCCLISTDYDGIREFAVNEENSLLSPVNDEEKLYQNVKRVFQDEILAQKLIANARNKAREFSLDEAFKVFIESLKM